MTKKKRAKSVPKVISKDQIYKMFRAANRQLAIESGEYTNRGAGSGSHGGTKKQRNRRDRREQRNHLRDDLE